MVSKHYNNQRSQREKFIDEHFENDYIVDEFIVDRGHPHGAERHCITNNGIVIIYNLNSGKLITKILARPRQIKRYYKSTGREHPNGYKKILALAAEHKNLGYHNL